MAFILATCTACSHEFRLADRHAGKQVACPHCRKAVNVPGAVPAASGDRLVGREIGDAVLVRRLGAGALGVVYEATDRQSGKPVAVKLLSSKAAEQPDVVARFQREAELSQSISHPNVVAVLRHGFDRGVHWIVMEFVAGGTLAGLVEDGPLPWQEACGLVVQASQAVAALHQRGVLHRDIKPANLLWTGEGSARIAKLADLGLAKQQDAEGAQGLTMQGVALGSPAYMPPEQIMDAKSVTPAADVYALGVTLYQLVSCRLPFEGRSGAEMMGKVLDQPPAPIRTYVQLPAGVDALIMQCLDKDKTRRPPDAGALATALQMVIAKPDAVLNPPAAPVRRASRPRRAGGGGGPGAMIIVIIAIAALAAGIAAYVLLK
jgi:serine/threonine protein kinase